MDSSPPTGTLSAAATPPRSEGSDSDDDGIICEETLAGTGPYSFRITLGKHDEYDSVVTFSVMILQGGHHGQTVGYLTGRVIDRDLRPRWQFHELCDGESAELEEVGVTFCDGDGKIIYKDIDGLSAESDSAASRGGFLHIGEVKIYDGHRRMDLGLACIKTLLEWLNARDAREREEHQQAWMNNGRKPEWQYLHAGWTLAVLGVEYTSHREETEEERARPLVVQHKVGRHWARLGFRQARFGSHLWYVTPERLTQVRKEEVAGLHISSIPEPPPIAPAPLRVLRPLRKTGSASRYVSGGNPGLHRAG
ncbi:hypothetical protein T484DRAFT_1838827 [Baffinella frigidus]|nr:hypothetical protein T484DRAFT_1838827 [Cryptophyta sp. CCMP2293]